jgi:hypothetical protein
VRIAGAAPAVRVSVLLARSSTVYLNEIGRADIVLVPCFRDNLVV